MLRTFCLFGVGFLFCFKHVQRDKIIVPKRLAIKEKKMHVHCLKTTRSFDV